ncbi:MAG: CoA-binding protein [Actinobacteria bacterium]|nr:CoA-binding protein [Actinomycetota bacterium]
MITVGFDFEEIDAIINARSLAIVGASAKPVKFGSLFTATQLTFGFKGPVWLVNPGEKEILGRPVYPDLRSLPEVPDLVYLTIPAHRSMDILEDCADLGVKGVIIMAAGFREAGGEGAALEAKALRLAREGGFRIVGPNCFGIYNPRNRLALLPGHDFSDRPGDVAYISQSGGFSVHVGRQCKSLGIDFSAIVSYGNGADLNEIELLRYFAADPQTSIIGAYLEGTTDGRLFAAALAEAASRKTVVIWKVGKSESSSRAVTSHTGSMAGSSMIWEGLLRQCDAIEVSGVDETCDVLLALKHLGRRPGRRLFITGGGGGLGTYAADLAEEEGLEVPPLLEETASRLRAVLAAPGAAVGNPTDIGTPLVPLPVFEAVMETAASDPGTDILIFDLALNFGYGLGGEEGLIAAADVLVRARRKSGKPVVLVLYSRANGLEDLHFEEILRRLRSRLLQEGVLVFPSMQRAMRALALING